jgi:hypothetical protein
MFFLGTKKTKKIRKKYPDLLNFSITIFATFLGVYLAIYYNNKGIEYQEKQTTLKLLNAASNELNLINIDTQLRIEKISEAENIKYTLSNHTIPYPTILQNSMRNEIVLKNLSDSSLRAVNNGFRTLNIMYRKVTSPNEYMAHYDKDLIYYLNYYSRTLYFCEKILLNESEFLNGKINKKEFENNINKDYEKLNK